ncbi:DUF397 domain-containing protein [Streptomyces hirsutus]|uniref:DUF397 domain-containing protein n=1 Tax=Streptomyces hirsutus TaxID=35620 RepID=UPI0033D6BFF8
MSVPTEHTRGTPIHARPACGFDDHIQILPFSAEGCAAGAGHFVILGRDNECVEVAHALDRVSVRDSTVSTSEGFVVGARTFTKFADGLKGSVTPCRHNDRTAA